MATEYLKCTITGMSLNGSYPSPPNVLYIPYPLDLTYRVIGTVVFFALDFYFDVYDYPVGSPIVIYYRSYKSLPAHHDYAELHESFNTDFAAAIAAGNLSGSYVGREGATWNIDHVVHNDTISLPSGEGGESGTVFTQSPPTNQPPGRATSPSPADGAAGVSLGTTKLDWT